MSSKDWMYIGPGRWLVKSIGRATTSPTTSFVRSYVIKSLSNFYPDDKSVNCMFKSDVRWCLARVNSGRPLSIYPRNLEENSSGGPTVIAFPIFTTKLTCTIGRSCMLFYIAS